jgi:hypothetical protein
VSEESVFMEAGNKGMLCELDLRDGNFVTVEPYAIFTSNKKRRCVLYYQVSRAGAKDDKGWRQTETGQIRGAKMLNQPFAIRKDYNPLDKITYVMMHYSLPNADGKQRPVDLAPAWDKSVHNRPAGT